VKALQSASPESQTPAITTKQLHHLLRLSALPLPRSAEEEAGMIRTLEAQLHFVRAIQSVDTTGVEPLASIRDETSASDSENEITADSLKDEFAKEKQVGFARRIVREHEEDPKDAEHFDPLAQAPRKLGRYIVVNTKED
jgi:Asp-tRNA(Asn)/Glu-tRNA(Gln) amidotransferase C subunit